MRVNVRHVIARFRVGQKIHPIFLSIENESGIMIP